jgi:hypothetical protein
MDKKRAPIDSELFYHSDSRNDVRITCYLQLTNKLRHDRKQVTHKADIRNLEYRRVFVLVDRDDDLGILHAGQMLNRAGDADRDIYFWSDDLAGLADNFQVTAALRYGGIMLPFAIGAVVVGLATACQTPDSGQRSPVRAVVPIGARA